MESQNTYSIYANEYSNIDTKKIATILLKDGTVLNVNQNLINISYGQKSLNRNTSDSSLPVNNPNNLAKVRKFNSFSSNINNKANANNKFQLNGFYVTPIINGTKKLLTIKNPIVSQNIDLDKNNYHIENITFKASPKKYIYKPYKPPKRKNNLIKIDTNKNHNFYCSNPSFVNKK